MEIEKLGCGLTEIKLIDNAYVVNEVGDTVFNFKLQEDSKGNKTNEVIRFNNKSYLIYNRTDGGSGTIYLAKSRFDYLGVFITKKIISYNLLTKKQTTDFIIEKLLF